MKYGTILHRPWDGVVVMVVVEGTDEGIMTDEGIFALEGHHAVMVLSNPDYYGGLYWVPGQTADLETNLHHGHFREIDE